jgi:hypothetical protein
MVTSLGDEYCLTPGVGKVWGGGSKADSSGLVDCIYAVTIGEKILKKKSRPTH